MGITTLSIKRIQPYLNKGVSMLQIGCQNLYFEPYYGHVAHNHFVKQGIDVRTVDITGCQGSEVFDLRELHDLGQFDIVTDFGSGEHVDGNFYNFHRNIHNATKLGGIIIHENPKTGNWPEHGCNYVDMEFYILLAEEAGYEVIELTEEAAMGNTIDGWNVSVVLRKVDDMEFISEKQFKQIGHVFSK
jgi:hypothetical protein